ncbi:MAG: TIGR03960 family B12-binding radical SAM protein [Actinomycetota bacterium]|nr:TIGR03960 family B12-binding radical SAM protein [Actinomycetota bacterium]
MGGIKRLDFELLEELLEGIEKPGRYIGKEIGTKSKDPRKIKNLKEMVFMALVFPDIYEVGMSNLGLQILYDIVNGNKNFSVERVFSPWVDFEEKLRKRRVKIFSLENRIFLDSFDLIGFTIQHEMLYTNTLNVMDLGGINIHSKQRGEDSPLICAGGSAVVNPQPISKFMDFFVIGDGEEIVTNILEKVRLYKKNDKGKSWFLKEINRLDGIYVPDFYKFYYYQNGLIKDFKPRVKVKKAVVRKLDKFRVITDPIIPNIRVVHDRFIVEIMRGCWRSCRFCQAGIIYRPVRKREVKSLIRKSIKGIKNTGYDEISFLSLSSSDYGEIENLVGGVTGSLKSKRLSISMPSLRLNSASLGFLELIQSGRKTGLTFAPEAGTQRMRDVINKNIKEDEMLECIKLAFGRGWEKIKLYFMIGLPFENEDDIRGIVELVEKIINAARNEIPKRKLKRLKINISINAFCPKPFTPFQWVGIESPESLKRKFDFILSNIPRRYVNIKWSDPWRSLVECALSKGSGLLCDVIEDAWRNGAKFDNWSDFFNYEIWKNAFENSGVDIGLFTTRNFTVDEILPWDVIDIRVRKKSLLKEYEKSKKYV